MSHPRAIGIAMLAMGMIILWGTMVEALPNAAFWAGLATSPIGIVIFMKGNRRALRSAEIRAARALQPSLQNRAFAPDPSRIRSGQDFGVEELGEREHTVAQRAEAPQLEREEITLYEVAAEAELEPVIGTTPDDEKDDALPVSTDVSFPLEIQEESALADQLEKLRTLAREGIIDEKEFASAKAKLLR